MANLCTLVVLLSLVFVSAQNATLDGKVMMLAERSAFLSSLVRQETIQRDMLHDGDFDFIHLFTKEPDHSLIAKTNGYCFGVFRFTTYEFQGDFLQNLDPEFSDACGKRRPIISKLTTDKTNKVHAYDQNQEVEEVCCSVRAGFARGYNTPYQEEFEEVLRNCARDCEDPDECVVLTGFSQGGSIAQVASIYLSDLNPQVFTFSGARAIKEPCAIVSSERHYRFINSIEYPFLGLVYDGIAFSPGLGADHFGHFLILTEDHSGILDFGLNADPLLLPVDLWGVHRISTMHERIQAVIYFANGKYPIRTTGYASGFPCTRDEECESRDCRWKSFYAFTATCK